MEKIRKEMTELFQDRVRVSVARAGQTYQKPYDHRFESGRSTHEHVGQFVAHLGELADGEAFRVHLFSLCLTGTASTWYATMPPNSINSWNDLESKFYEDFFSGEYELGLAELASVRQGHDEREMCPWAISKYFGD
jgi:hypothetical protein